MKYTEHNNTIILTNYNSFDIEEILECGQCFRFEKLKNNGKIKHYSLIALGKLLYIEQKAENIIFYYESSPLTIDEFKDIWIPYFDLDRDYEQIKSFLAKDAILSRAIAFAPGIRLLQQDPFEMIVSFIISQNNRIPQIKQVIKNISEKYGSNIYNLNFAFPSPDELFIATQDELRQLKTGFRDKYIVAAMVAVFDKKLSLARNNDIPTEQLRQSLLSVKGIGEKVAHCILLFGYGRYDVFPVDTWVRKIMQGLYFNGEAVSVKQMHSFAKEKFGEYSGFANQYLFHYIRLNEKAAN